MMTIVTRNSDLYQLKLSLFDDRFGFSAREEALSLFEFKQLCLATRTKSKDQLPLFSGAQFGDKRSVRNSLRHNANVISITGIVGDYDDEKMPFSVAVERLKTSALTGILYTSASHTAATPRWRVVVPLSCELEPSYHGKLLNRLNGILGGILAPESWNLSQAYYFGFVEGGEDQQIEVIQ